MPCQPWLMGQTKLKIDSFLPSVSTLSDVLVRWKRFRMFFASVRIQLIHRWHSIWRCFTYPISCDSRDVRAHSMFPTAHRAHPFGHEESDVCLPFRHARQTHRRVRNRFQYMEINWKVEIRARSPPSTFVHPFLTHALATYHQLPSTTAFSPPTHTQIQTDW